MEDSIQVGGYAIGRTIGRGTFSRVKLATHLKTQERVAVKILEKDKLLDNHDVQSVMKQLFIMKIVKHCHIVRLYQLIETSRYMMLVMEYVEGGQLFAKIIKQGRIAQDQARILFQQLISSVQYLHKLNIVHRDIKPQNILMSGDSIKLIDFGLSSIYSEDLKTMCGSLCYAAPEMLKQQPYDGKKADIWSCGIVLYAMLCGCLPFQSENVYQQYQNIRRTRWQTTTILSAEAQDLLRRILNIDVNDRYSIEQIQRHPWMRHSMVRQIDIRTDYRVVEQMKQLGYAAHLVQRCLDTSQHNELTAVYHLLANRNRRQGLKPILLNDSKNTSTHNDQKQTANTVVECNSKFQGIFEKTGYAYSKNKQNICPKKTNPKNNKQSNIKNPQKTHKKGYLVQLATAEPLNRRSRQLGGHQQLKCSGNMLVADASQFVQSKKLKLWMPISTQMISTRRETIKTKRV